MGIIRRQYYQTAKEVVVVFYAKGKSGVHVDFSEESVDVFIQLSGGEETYVRKTKLSGKIIKEKSRFEVFPTKIEIHLAKEDELNWSSLEHDKKPSILSMGVVKIMSNYWSIQEARKKHGEQLKHTKDQMGKRDILSFDVEKRKREPEAKDETIKTLNEDIQMLREELKKHELNLKREQEANVETNKKLQEEIENLGEEMEKREGELEKIKGEQVLKDETNKKLQEEIQNLGEEMEKREGELEKIKGEQVLKDETITKLNEEIKKLGEELQMEKHGLPEIMSNSTLQKAVDRLPEWLKSIMAPKGAVTGAELGV
ncbi:unnamed protein product [Microthlaspi erraticum]|uniref:CS domain-containing protein n=1 Tax=Microthlaspi erraticum TaxID=1685480 RepID=A0A6D2L3F3_9BRAS|nr:unnamed protein product [Microthlaspi erraticum]